MKITVIHGPNLNLLGEREPEIYGRFSLADIDERAIAHGKSLGIDIEVFQSNSEGDLVSFIQKSSQSSDGLVINPAAYTHTSVALRDALAASDIPKVEVHLSNIYKREAFRHVSMTASQCDGVISGLGPTGYLLAISYLAETLG